MQGSILLSTLASHKSSYAIFLRKKRKKRRRGPVHFLLPSCRAFFICSVGIRIDIVLDIVLAVAFAVSASRKAGPQRLHALAHARISSTS